jgi:hypothetical protein
MYIDPRPWIPCSNDFLLASLKRKPYTQNTIKINTFFYFHCIIFQNKKVNVYIEGHVQCTEVHFHGVHDEFVSVLSL